MLILKFIFFPGGESEVAGGNAKSQKQPPALVDGFVVQASPLDQKLQVAGTILANEEVDLRPEISGRILHIFMKEGAHVEKGQLLVKLVDTDLQAQLRKIIAQQKLAESQRVRIEQLLKIEGVSQQEYDEAANQAEAFNADADVIRVQISRTEIRAPFSGAIGLRSVSEGSIVSPQDIIANVQQLNPIRIEFSVPGRYAQYIVAGKEIIFNAEGETQERKGIVYAVEPGIESSSRTLKIRAHADNPGNRIRPGSFARVNLILDHRQHALMIPSQAVVPYLKGQQVYMDSSGIAVMRPVTIGLREDKNVEITDGLKEGDTIIITGVMGLHPGSAVKTANLR